VLSLAACAVGNSSSFVRDASYFGTPVVLVGQRQDGRESDAHLVRVAASAGDILTSIRSQLAHGRYAASTLYGDGYVSERIARELTALVPYVQKRLHYIYDAELEPVGVADNADAAPAPPAVKRFSVG
jgi:UDP-N-acetylglucosamine 2-epimerase